MRLFVFAITLQIIGSWVACAAEVPSLSETQLREDLIYLRDIWLPTEKSFDSDERKAFETIVAGAMTNVNKLTRAAFSLEVSKAVATANNGHTLVMDAPGFHGLPFKAAWFSDGLYVVRVHPKFPELLGARIDRLGSLTPESALDRVTPYISGTDAHVRNLSPAYLRQLELLKSIGASASDRSAPIRFVLRDGKVRTIKLGCELNPDPEFLPQHQQLIRGRSDTPKPNRWLHVLDGVSELPIGFRPPVDIVGEWIGDNARILYIRSTQVLSTSEEPFQEKLAKVFFEYVLDPQQKVRPRHVIVDLRFNSGGNLLDMALFSSTVPKILPPGGKVVVLVGPGTFSAALATAAMLKGNGGSRTILVGDTMGDSPQFWAEGKVAVLPNSGIRIGSAMAFHDWANGCDDVSRCYWANTALAIKNTSLEPEIRIVPKFADYAAGRDPVLEAALGLTK